MDPRRLKLHELLKRLAPNVYFMSPPTNTAMKYPCLLYTRDTSEAQFADNGPYRNTKRYQVTVIDSDPDSDIPDKVAKLPLCSKERTFMADNLVHDVFNLYF